MPVNQTIIKEGICAESGHACDQRKVCLLGGAESDGETLRYRYEKEAERTRTNIRDARFYDFRDVGEYLQHMLRQKERYQKEQTAHAKVDRQREPRCSAYVRVVVGAEELSHECGVAARESEHQHPEDEEHLR